MKKSLLHAVSIIAFCLLLMNTHKSTAQQLNVPELEFTFACINENFNSFNATITFEQQIFNNDNAFYVELSDAEGNFDTPVTLQTITDKNFSFSFETNFSFPVDVAGEGYRIRVRATSPAMTGPATNPFNAYFVPDTILVLNDFTDIAICGGEMATLTLDQDIADVYTWYRNGVPYLQAGASIEVDQAGDYYAEPYYGNCTGSVFSNIVVVSFGEEFNAAIEGDDLIEACVGTQQTLSAQIDDVTYEYQWYFNGEQIQNLPAYQPQLTVEVTNETYGDYQLTMINSGGCQASSQVVTIQSNGSSATISAESPLVNLVVGGQSVQLEISTTSVDPRITWYKDGVLLNNGTTLSLTVSQPGEYFARVTSPESCAGVLESPVFDVLEPVALSANIVHASAYEACINTSTTLVMENLVAIAEGGLELEIPENLYGSFNLNWTKDGTDINYFQPTLPLNTFTDNGNYQLEIGYNELTFSTNMLEVQLGIPDNDITASTDFICANGGEATLSVTQYEGAVYNWYLNEELIQTSSDAVFTATNAGTYSVETQFKGCGVFSDDFDLNAFGEDVVQIFPSQTVFIQTGGSQEVSATGADSYQWEDANGLVISSSDSFLATEEGVYYLVAQKDGCEIRKEITVGISDVTVVPNIITPNQDNINDKWVLPVQFVNDPDVEIMICDTYGKPVLKTKSYNNNWPETNETSNFEASIYYYNIQKNGESIKKGSITVVNR